MAIKVWLDAGHGGSDPGATANGLVEKAMTLVSVLQTKVVLEAHGFEVGLTRSTDTSVDLDSRGKMANDFGAAIFVREHYNAGGGDGAEDIFSIYHGVGEQLANTVLAAINKVTGQNLRPSYCKQGDHGDYFAVIRETNMPCVIVEPAFIDSADRSLVDTIPEQQAMGTAIAIGILNHFGVTYAPVVHITPAAPVTVGIGQSKIASLQVALNAGGYSDNANNKLDVDGMLGKLTKEAMAKVALGPGATNAVVGWTQTQLGIPVEHVDSIYGKPPYGHETYDAVGKWQGRAGSGLSKDYVIGINTLLSLL